MYYHHRDLQEFIRVRII